uniref:Uncharacterized protein n=1 Tax=Leersia perrieri TaxID=77586 RepID=A0A0D9VNY6_9ORYZ
MLQASLESQRQSPATAAGMWVPGMSPDAVTGGGSARAQEIARRREEMLGMLRDLPESEYELSLTDLVEKAATAGGGGGVAPNSPSPSEGKETARTASGRQQQAAAGRPERRGSARRWDSGGGGGSFRSSSDGVLLNFYMPRSFTRSFTAPRSGPGRPPSVSGGRSAASVCSDHKRERDGETVRCWSLLWDRRWRKSSRGEREHSADDSTIRAASAAILKAAKHKDSSSPKKI